MVSVPMAASTETPPSSGERAVVTQFVGLAPDAGGPALDLGLVGPGTRPGRP